MIATARDPETRLQQPRSLWHDRDFVFFWSGQMAALAGSSLTHVAMPLLALLSLDATPIELSVLAACAGLPFLGLPLFAGVYLDRHRIRPALLVCTALQAVLLGVVFALAVSGHLTLPVLAGVALLTSAATVFFQVGELAYVPALVGRERLLGANASIAAARSGADMGGRGMAGLLVQTLGPPAAMLADAVLHAVATVMLAAIRNPEPVPDRPATRRIVPEIAEGWRFVWRTWPVRTMTVQGMLFNTAYQAFTVAFVLYAVKDLGISAGWWGMLLSIAGGAAMVGALAAPAAARRVGTGRAIVITAAAGHAPLLMVPAAGEESLPLVLGLWGVALGCSGMAAGLINVLVVTLRARLAPSGLLARVTASVRLLLFGGTPIGALCGGLLADTLGNRTSLWLTTSAMVATVAVLVPLWRLPEYPRTP